jgi:hypothetical protein
MEIFSATSRFVSFYVDKAAWRSAQTAAVLVVDSNYLCLYTIFIRILLVNAA